MSTHQTAKTSYVPYKDGKLAYRRFGASTGVPLLFLIHFRGTMDKWDPLLINSVAKSRPVILFDYAGVGQSTGEVAESFRQSAEDVIEFLSLIKVKEVDVLGFSIGGFVAELVTLNADPSKLKVRKLILAGTGASAGSETVNSPNNYLPAATSQDIDVAAFKELFFSHTPEGEKLAEEWWARIHERSEATSGETPSKWLSQGYTDGAAGIQKQGNAIQLWTTPETSTGQDGSHDRLSELDIPVLVANGLVSETAHKAYNCP